MRLPSVLLLVLGASIVNAQSFLSSIGAYPQLSRFYQLLINQPGIAGSLTSRNATDNKTTVMVPNNDAFTNYYRNTGQNVEGLQSSDLTDLVQYHSLNGALSSSDLQQPTGLAASTGLTDPQYGNLGLSSNGAVMPQPVFIGSGAPALATRQDNQTVLYAQSGLTSNASINTIDAAWEGGLFHIVDNIFVFPQVQTNTMTAFGVSSFVEALNRTNLTYTFNSASGFTSFCPIDLAFSSLGNATADISVLASTLERHATNSSQYTSYLRDGEIFPSYNGYPILVTNKNGSIYLNDAKLIATNFPTQNGAMHVLDRIMGYLNTTTNVTTPVDTTPIGSSTTVYGSPSPSTSGGTASTTATIAVTVQTVTATSTSSPPAQVTTNAGSLTQAPQYPLSFVGMLVMVLGGIFFI